MSTPAQSQPEDIHAFLERHLEKELLRFVTVGSVDDGKSTLIGRLLYDTKGLFDDQIQSVKQASRQTDLELDLSLFTDGLKAEREQGITIDVAYRYFTTDKRKFIIADTPGHVQYTRNMATGASTADVAIILIDARLGVLQQSRRHAFIAGLLGIPHLAVCVNKMDLVGFDPAVFERISEEFRQFTSSLGFRDVSFFPVSARDGDNIVSRSERARWYSGRTLLEYLETVPVTAGRNLTSFRFPVQYVLRPDLTYRGFAGEVASGKVRVGDEIMVLPSRRRSRVTAIDTLDGQLDEAVSRDAVTIRLADEVDISRGDMLVHPHDQPRVARRFEAMLVWMGERPLDQRKSYFLKHTTQYVRADFEQVQSTVDLETLTSTPAETLHLNDIGRVTIHAHRTLQFDPYTSNRATGAFIVVDSATNGTVGAGMLLDPAADADADALSSDQPHTQVSPAERRERLGHGAALLASSGPEAASIAFATERLLFDRGVLAVGARELSVEATAQLLAAGLVVVVAGGVGELRTAAATQGVPVVEGEASTTDTEQAARELVDAAERLGVF